MLLDQARRGFENWQAMVDIEQDGLVQHGDYKYLVAFLKKRKEALMNHWPWDDMDEEMYM